ncbi:MAG: aminotransferase [Oscillospiraceae bacterium]|nr:aminotransferase [Oscillospiraceae bacterium]
MKIKAFAVEEWMNAYETGAKYNIAETCVNSISLNELFALCGEDRDSFLNAFFARRMTYGDIEGAPAFRKGICRLYHSIHPNEVITTHGAAGANHHVFYSLVEPGDRVISVIPSYQQLYSIPECYGADVQILRLREKNGWLPDLQELRSMITPGTKLICINNPNNPTGALMPTSMLREIVELARSVGAYVLCDEVYRHLTQDDDWSESITDLYEKGISVSSMSKVFSLAGLRLGWIATHDRDLLRTLLSHRDYNHISCGMFDEAVAGLALNHADALLKRSRSIVRENLATVAVWMSREPYIRWFCPQAGTTALISYDYGLPSYEFCLRMYRESGAFVTPGDCFEQPKSFRLGYACDAQTLRDGLAACSAFFRSLEAER